MKRKKIATKRKFKKFTNDKRKEKLEKIEWKMWNRNQINQKNVVVIYLVHTQPGFYFHVFINITIIIVFDFLSYRSLK